MQRFASSSDARIEEEQRVVDSMFTFVDHERESTEARMRDVLRRRTHDPRGLVERETAYASLQDRLTQLSSAEVGLCFGRIDVNEDEGETPENPVPGRPELDRRYIGRLGLSDRADEYRTLLMDWRAQAARPFYLATTARPEGVETRRHLRTTGRRVIRVDDEILSGADSTSSDVEWSQAAGAGDETPLLAALNAARSGHMTDIVETIQREQDEIIRDPYRGVTVVEGGPGTGKTAVALHRAAYLLYTWRDILAKTGVLVIGPNNDFISYISRVLPTLGEGGVVLSTIGNLYPGITSSRRETPLTREVKGSTEMVEILTQAVRQYQKVPDHATDLIIDGHQISISPTLVKTARTRARRSRKPHNSARLVFQERFLDELAELFAEQIGNDPLGGANLLDAHDKTDLRADCAEDPTVIEFMESMWPELEPETVLATLLSSRELIDAAASDYDETTRNALWREDGWNFSTSDAALIDELAEIVGVKDPEDEIRAEREEWLSKIAEAQDALDILTGSASQDVDDGFDPEILMAYDVIDAETLAERHRTKDTRTTSQRAQQDRLWAYGHVIVDEAQELSAMDWRMVMRRCPNRWMTIVGDTAQTGSPAGVDSWAETLKPFVNNRWHHHQLTVNYRTPAEISDIANLLLEDVAPGRQPDRAIRQTGRDPEWYRAKSSENADVVATAREVVEALIMGGLESADSASVWTASEAESTGAIAGESTVAIAGENAGAERTSSDGETESNRSIAIITSDDSADVRAQLEVQLEPLKSQWPNRTITVSGTSDMKGLEFDHVVIVEPAHIIDDSTQGYQNLFVAMTRATQTLSVVYSEDPVVELEES